MGRAVHTHGAQMEGHTRFYKEVVSKHLPNGREVWDQAQVCWVRTGRGGCSSGEAGGPRPGVPECIA